MEKKLEIGYYKYTIDQLPADDKLLVIEAQAALMKAYAKYSGFHVGAAVRLASGKILHSEQVMTEHIIVDEDFQFYVQLRDYYDDSEDYTIELSDYMM